MNLRDCFKNLDGYYEPFIGEIFQAPNGAVVKTIEDDFGNACAKSNCTFKNDKTICDKICCSKKNRDDGFDVRFVEI